MNKYFCFYTSHYADWSKKCIDSFARFDLPVEPIQLPDGKQWMENCMSRSALMCGAAELYPNDGIGLLDADLTCLKDPLLLKVFKGEGCDIWGDVAVHDLTDIGRMPDDKCSRYSAGVTCFAPTPSGRACLRLWVDKCREDRLKGLERLREQVYLYEAIQESKAKVFNLGKFYNCPLDENYEPEHTVILHHVASRQLRPVVGGSI